jgi:transposase
MKGFTLTQQQVLELRIAHNKERARGNVPAAYKINAVILLGTGWKLKKVSEALLTDDETLRSYIGKYSNGDIESLIETNYKGGHCFLSKEQIQLLREELESDIYLTTAAVAEFVESTFNVKYSCSGMCKLLHSIGYEYKKPTLVPGNPDLEAQELFAEQYEDFMLKKPNDVEVLFVDAVHPQHNSMAAYGWIKRGHKREVKTNSGRDRINLHGAMNAETLEVTLIESDTVNADSSLQLFEMINNKYPTAPEILLILDNARYHYSNYLREELLKYPRIKLVFLPPYSPNLNLIERLWKFFKKKVLYNRYHENIKEFRKSCIHFFKNIDLYADELRSIMSGGFEMRNT